MDVVEELDVVDDVVVVEEVPVVDVVVISEVIVDFLPYLSIALDCRFHTQYLHLRRRI